MTATISPPTESPGEDTLGPAEEHDEMAQPEATPVQETERLGPIRKLLDVFQEAMVRLELTESREQIIEAYAVGLQQIDEGIASRKYDPRLGLVAAGTLCTNWQWRGMPNGIDRIEAQSFVLVHNKFNRRTPITIIPREEPVYEEIPTGRGHDEGTWSIQELSLHAKKVSQQNP
ncbi:hypothetical protein JW710_02100 [Candidatus Dojkabacteria bacterium]|nr:hypothetical protein [Candidatus Dojkabacteria bacterium]